MSLPISSETGIRPIDYQVIEEEVNNRKNENREQNIQRKIASRIEKFGSENSLAATVQRFKNQYLKKNESAV